MLVTLDRLSGRHPKSDFGRYNNSFYSLGLATTPARSQEIKDAIKTANKDAVPDEIASTTNPMDPMTWVAKNWLGFTDTNTAGNKDTASSTTPYAGQLRDFATALVASFEADSVAAAATVGGGTTVRLPSTWEQRLESI